MSLPSAQQQAQISRAAYVAQLRADIQRRLFTQPLPLTLHLREFPDELRQELEQNYYSVVQNKRKFFEISVDTERLQADEEEKKQQQEEKESRAKRELQDLLQANRDLASQLEELKGIEAQLSDELVVLRDQVSALASENHALRAQIPQPKPQPEDAQPPEDVSEVLVPEPEPVEEEEVL